MDPKFKHNAIPTNDFIRSLKKLQFILGKT